MDIYTFIKRLENSNHSVVPFFLFRRLLLEAFISGIHSSSAMLALGLVHTCPLVLLALKRVLVRSFIEGKELEEEDGYSRRLERPTAGVSKLLSGFVLIGEHSCRRGEQTSAPMYPSGKSQSSRVKSMESLRSCGDFVSRHRRNLGDDDGRGRVPSQVLVSSNDSTAASTYSSGRSYSDSFISWLLIGCFLNTPSMLLVDDDTSD